jgi:hypothetical protein
MHEDSLKTYIYSYHPFESPCSCPAYPLLALVHVLFLPLLIISFAFPGLALLITCQGRGKEAGRQIAERRRG